MAEEMAVNAGAVKMTRYSEDAPIEIARSEGSSRLYCFFGGIASGIDMPPFEFYNASRIIDENKIFLRDFRQSWYQAGLPGLSTDIHSTAEYIDQVIGSLAPKQLYFVGNSMGGFAAILFAHLLGKGEVVSFAPQTFISPSLRLRHRDFRWRKSILATYANSLFKPKAWDLRKLLLRSQFRQKTSVFVSRTDHLDYIHACHIADIPQVSVYEFSGGGHGIVKVLRDNGMLPTIMTGTYKQGEQSPSVSRENMP